MSLSFATGEASIIPPPSTVCFESHSLFSSPTLQSNVLCILWPQDEKRAPVWRLKLPSLAKSFSSTPASSHDLLFLLTEHSRSCPALGFSLTLLQWTLFPGSFHSSGRGWVYAAHFLPPPNDKPTHPFCSVGFTENHQEEKENNKRTHVEEMWQYKNAYITA